jgi:tRNA-specific 2-thiouridylase
MSQKKGKVFIALSGGVDSSTAAALLIEQGYDCSGIFMITSDRPKSSPANAKAIAKKLGIKLHLLDLRTEFEKVLEYFTNEYKSGRTPNPCVYCNRYIKFTKLLEFAKTKGADFFATGHYAAIHKNTTGEPGLYAATDLQKDQSYALAMLDRKILEQLIFPLGRYSKEQTRSLASKFGLEIEGRQESQEICFIPDDDYAAVLESRCPQIVKKGKIIDSSGKVLGEHNGTHRFTIGQRRGLRVAMGVPYYVVDIDAKSNTVTLGTKEQTLSSTLLASGVNWLADKPGSAFTAKVKIRYNSKAVSARVIPQEDNVIIEFESKVSAVTPGQLAVFYVKDNFGSRVIGGGWIERPK